MCKPNATNMRNHEVKSEKSIVAVGWGYPPPCKNGCYNLVAGKGFWFYLRVLGLASKGHTGRSGPLCGCLPGITGSEAMALPGMVPGKVAPISPLHASPLPSSGFWNVTACLEGPLGKL